MGYSVIPWLIFSGFSSDLHKSFLQSQTSARAIHLDVASGYFFALSVSFVPIQMGWLHHQTPCFAAYSLALDHYTDSVFCWCRWWHPDVQERHFPDGLWDSSFSGSVTDSKQEIVCFLPVQAVLQIFFLQGLCRSLREAHLARKYQMQIRACYQAECGYVQGGGSSSIFSTDGKGMCSATFCSKKASFYGTCMHICSSL